MSKLKNRAHKLVQEFESISDWEQKYELIIAKGKNLPPLPEIYRTEKNIVKGCQSQVWLFAERKQNTIHFFADSDALIVKGLIAVLLELFQDLEFAEIIHADLSVLKTIGLDQHLSPSRSNGLQAMIKQMRLYAFVFSQTA